MGRCDDGSLMGGRMMQWGEGGQVNSRAQGVRGVAGGMMTTMNKNSP